MTKPITDQVKAKKAAKLLSEDKAKDDAGQIIDEKDTPQDELVDDEDSGSSVLTDDDGVNLSIATSGEDTDQLMAKALDTIEKQASESKVVIPVAPSASPKVMPDPRPDLPTTSKNPAEASDSGESSSDGTQRPLKPVSASRKLEAQRRRLRKAKKLSKERKEKLKAKVASQVMALAVATAATTHAQDNPTTSSRAIPKLSPARIRQQKAVTEAKNRMGLTSKYGNLSNLLELHRMLLKGNPFSLIEPKQVYPHFHLIPGVNSTIIQPLVREWQEKATKILYQLLLIETRGDIARLKKRTMLFKADPISFPDAFLLKVDIGLENATDLPADIEKSPGTPGKSVASTLRPGGRPVGDENQPPPKKSRKVLSALPV